jgi:hypothetical protein
MAYTALDPQPSMAQQKDMEVRELRHKLHQSVIAAEFFRENPAFDQFVRLIRAGVIHV